MTCHANSVLPEIRDAGPQDTPLANIAEIHAREGRGLGKNHAQRFDSPLPVQASTAAYSDDPGRRRSRSEKYKNKKKDPRLPYWDPPEPTDA